VADQKTAARKTTTRCRVVFVAADRGGDTGAAPAEHWFATKTSALKLAQSRWLRCAK